MHANIPVHIQIGASKMYAVHLFWFLSEACGWSTRCRHQQEAWDRLFLVFSWFNYKCKSSYCLCFMLYTRMYYSESRPWQRLNNINVQCSNMIDLLATIKTDGMTDTGSWPTDWLLHCLACSVIDRGTPNGNENSAMNVCQTSHSSGQRTQYCIKWIKWINTWFTKQIAYS